jgi:hypothetical protein
MANTVQASKGGLTYQYRAFKTVTFANTSGTVNIFTVTGTVNVEVSPVCTVTVASVAGANIELGISGATGVIVPTTLSTGLAANEFWYDATPTASIEAKSGRPNVDITNGSDIILTLSAQVDTGSITFYALWAPLSDDGLVVAA